MSPPFPNYDRPAVETGPNGETVINWLWSDIHKPFSEDGPTMKQRARILGLREEKRERQ